MKDKYLIEDDDSIMLNERIIKLNYKEMTLILPLENTSIEKLKEYIDKGAIIVGYTTI